MRGILHIAISYNIVAGSMKINLARYGGIGKWQTKSKYTKNCYGLG